MTNYSPYCDPSTQNKLYADIEISVEEINFGKVIQYKSSAPKLIKITNSNEVQDAAITGISYSFRGFEVDAKQLPAILKPKESAYITAVFHPSFIGEARGFIKISTVAHDAHLIGLVGEGYKESSSSGSENPDTPSGSSELKYWKESHNDLGSILEPVADETNASVFITPKGKGAINASKNAKSGTNAVDFQRGSNGTYGAKGESSFIASGISNVIKSIYGCITTGSNNSVESNSDNSFIGTGDTCSIIGSKSFIGAALESKIEGTLSFIGSGSKNQVLKEKAFIGSGTANVIKGSHSSIVSGESNTIEGQRGFIGSGLTVTIKDTSSIGSGYNVTLGSMSSIGYASDTTVAGELNALGSVSQANITNSKKVVIGSGSNITVNRSEQTFIGSGTGTTVESSNGSFVGIGLEGNKIYNTIEGFIGTGNHNNLDDAKANTAVKHAQNNSIENGRTNLISSGQYNNIFNGDGNNILGCSYVNLSAKNCTVTFNDINGEFSFANVFASSNGTITQSSFVNLLGCLNSNVKTSVSANILGSDYSTITNSDWASIISGFQGTITNSKSSVILGGHSNQIQDNRNSTILSGSGCDNRGNYTIGSGSKGCDLATSYHRYMAISEGVAWEPNEEDSEINWTNNNPVFQQGEVTMMLITDPAFATIDSGSATRFAVISKQYYQGYAYHNRLDNHVQTLCVPENSYMSFEFEATIANFSEKKVARIKYANGLVYNDGDKITVVNQPTKVSLVTNSNTDLSDLTLTLITVKHSGNEQADGVTFELPQGMTGWTGGGVFKYQFITKDSVISWS